jgi:hypothetical protein
MSSDDQAPRERKGSPPATLWKSVVIYGSCWFWLGFGIWAVLQCIRAECAFVALALTTRLPYTLAAWVVGALFFGGLLWLLQRFMLRSASHK